MAEAVIEARGLTKHFRVAERADGMLGAVRSLFYRRYVTKKAVDGVTFTVRRGELVGYVGPNGAGKSTTVKMLTGILVPTAGEVRVNGLVPYRHRIANARRIGVVFGQRTQLWWDLPAADSFELLRHIYRVPAEVYRRNMGLFDELLGLREFLDTPVRQLSLGQRMRCDLAAALLHDPDVVYLDEPTIGLDVTAKRRIREFIRAMNRERGVTVVLTTHDMADIEKLCHRILVINRGRIVYDGPLAELRARYGVHRTLVAHLQPGSPIPQLAGATLVEAGNDRVRYRFDSRETTASALITELMAAAPLQDVRIEEEDIDWIIERIYEETGAGAASGG